MMKVPPLSLVGMERLPLPLPFSPELLWRYNSLAAGQSHAAAAAAVAAGSANAAAANMMMNRAAAAAVASLPSPIAAQLPFAYDIKHTIPMSLANDPRVWSREDVLAFLQWCEREFDLPAFDTERFQMNGKALCLLTKSDLELRAPCSGDVIHNALQLLMNSSSVAESPLTPHTPLRMAQLHGGKGPWSLADLQHYAVAAANGNTSVTLSPAPSLDGQAGSPQDQQGSANGSTNGNGQALTNGHSSAGSSSVSSSASAASGGPHSDDSEYDSVGESPERSPGNLSMSPPPPPNAQHQLAQHMAANNGGGSSQSKSSSAATSSFTNGASKLNLSPGNINGGNENSEYNNNGRLLWDFLQQLLNDPGQRYKSFIAWKNVETGIFKIVDPPGLARLWGIQKNHLSMNYDKMSRALRYYYRVNILRKVQGERHCYQFLRNPGELKSIKNISMLRHQQQTSPVSLTVKCEPGAFPDPNEDYVDDDMPTDLSMDSERHMKEEMD